MNMYTDTTKWLQRFIDKKGRSRRMDQIYIEDNARFGQVAFATDGRMMAIARTDEEPTGVYHPYGPRDSYPLGWTRVIPKPDDFSTSVTVPTVALARAIMRADVIARRARPARPVHLIIEPRVVRVRADVPDIGQIETVIDGELDGRPIAIALDAKRVLTILRGWSSVSNGKRRKSSTLDGADETIIRVGEPDKAIMIQPADIVTAGRFAMLMPMLKPNIEVIEPAPKPEPGPVAEPKPEPVAEPKPEPVAKPVAKPEPKPVAKPEPDPEPKPEPDPEPKPEPDRLTIHPKIELTPAKARRIVEHWSAVLEFAQTGTLASANGARLVHYDTCTVLDLGGKRNKYTQWKAGIIAQHEEVIRAYVNENR